ncbi:hypothetical protein N7481_002926 [Penicillium waksmanii]|uniref:uncharacterized protein n=1 Tax=Penicillium waksmanii TaxID=69791 RepID=UPI0025471EAD|nr:uncharacterized protein N7481_002926 [Penicillium waksmanii]KAJ5987716.1 hypothetical protein N7481_002926 [Penicillium waksmanii]
MSGQPLMHPNLDAERTSLYSRRSKLRLAWKKNFIQDWWDSAYDEYISGNEFTERDKTFLFQLFKKFLPERARLREALFKQAMLDRIIGRQCLDDMVKLCTSTERVVYYPGLYPVENCCPVCSKPMSDVEDNPWVAHRTNNAMAMGSVHTGGNSVILCNFAISVQIFAVKKENGRAIVKRI